MRLSCLRRDVCAPPRQQNTQTQTNESRARVNLRFKFGARVRVAVNCFVVNFRIGFEQIVACDRVKRSKVIWLRSNLNSKCIEAVHEPF